MKSSIARRIWVATFVVFVANPCLAEKGGNGNGGGKPGGGDPPTPPPSLPVEYSVTKVDLPGDSFWFNDHNQSTSAVGWDFDRAVAYLPTHPTLPSTSAYYLDDLPIGGVDPAWHFRSAVGINNHGDIVGNLEPTAAPNTVTRPFLILDADGPSPQLHVLGPFDPSADREAALRINDSGDLIVWSRKDTPEGSELSLFVGNPGLHGNPAIPFTQLMIPQGVDLGSDIPVLSNRLASGEAVIAGNASTPDGTNTFRTSFDGSDFELAPAYVDESGLGFRGASLSNADINDEGDVALNALALLSRPKGQNKLGNFNTFAALWSLASPNEYEALGNADPATSALSYARMNNNDDFVFETDRLWHGQWSDSDDLFHVPSLLDSSDPNSQLYSHLLELTDRDGTDWPTLLAEGNEEVGGVEEDVLLILTPHLISTTAATTAAPEPAATLLALSLLALAGRRRG